MRFSLHHGGQKGCLGRGGCCTEPAMLLKACTPGFNQCCELAPQELGPDTCVSAHEGARPLCHEDHTSPFAKLRGYEPTCLRHCKHRVLSASATSGWRAGDGSRVFRSRHGYPMCLLSCSMGPLVQLCMGKGEAAARNVLRPQQHAELGRTGVFPAAGNCTGESQFE